MEIKIAHCADIHIGASYTELGEKSSVISQEIKDSFFNILNICKNENVDALLIAGDLFDDVDVSQNDVKQIIGHMENCDYKIFISPGNHDPFTINSPYQMYKWPENVTIFGSKELEHVEIKDKNTLIWGCGFQDRYEYESLLKSAGEKVKEYSDYLNICVMHADINNSGSSDYNPITISEIKDSKFDYIALGHVHKRSEISNQFLTHYAYCGNPQGSGFDETGEKGFYIGTVKKGVCNINFMKLSERTFENLSIDISDIEYFDYVYEKIIGFLKENFKDTYNSNAYRITLEGAIPEDLVIDKVLLEQKLQKDIFYVKIIDNSEIKIDEKKLQLRKDLKSIFIRNMLNKIHNSADSSEVKIAKEALKIGIKAFRKDVKYIDN